MDKTVAEQVAEAIATLYPHGEDILRVMKGIDVPRLETAAWLLRQRDFTTEEGSTSLDFLLRVGEGDSGKLLAAMIVEHPQNKALKAAYTRWDQDWQAGRGLRELDANAVEADARQRLQLIPGKLAAIEALWDGNTFGWFVRLSAVYVGSYAAMACYQDHYLASLSSDYADPGLFTDQALTRPDAIVATHVGQRLAAENSVPFYFASPDKPDLDLPRWSERG